MPDSKIAVAERVSVWRRPGGFASMRVGRRVLAGVAAALAWVSWGPTATAGPPGTLRFADAGDGSFHFDTGILRGRARAGEDSKGLSEVTHLPTGQRIDGSVGLLTYYRVFTQGKRYGDGARKRPSEARLLEDGSLEVRWPSAADWPLDLKAVYRWAGAAEIDVETTVRAGRDLPGFEVFLSSYFDPAFPAASAVVGGAEGGPPVVMTAEPDAGVWQMLPRDDAAVGLIRDGRWAVPPSPVEWAIRPRTAAPAIFRAHAAKPIVALLMSEAGGCFAVSASHRGEKHFSAYLSLFGRDVAAGETVRARSRLAICAVSDAEGVLRLWKEFDGPGRAR